jgi:ribonuclease HI
MVSPAAIEDVECAAVAAALERAAELRLDELEVRIDSQVVVDWLTAARRPQRSRRSLRLVTAQLGKLGHVSFRWVPRDENAHVDQLVWAALSG